MSNFFNTLSGTDVRKNEIDLTSMRTTPRSAKRTPPVVETTQEEKEEPIVQVARQEEKIVEAPHEEQAEEEGELTVDIYNKDDTIVIQSTVAGVKPEYLDVAITDDMVTIRGRRERADQVKEDSYYYKELFWGTFSRQVILPEEIEQEDAEANLQHGLLTIRLPKKRHGVTQKLKVKVV